MSVMVLVKLSLIGIGGGVVWRYATLTHRLIQAWKRYEGGCNQEHSSYEVEDTYRRLQGITMLYVVIVLGILSTLF